MRKIAILIGVIAATFGIYWLAAAWGLERALAGWFEERRADGWQAEYSDIRVSGFPTRFDTRLSDIELADTYSGLAWSAPEFRFVSKALHPGTITATWPQKQLLATPLEKLTITSDVMQAGVVFTETTDLNLAHATMQMQAVTLATSQGARTSLEHGSLTMDQQPRGDDGSFVYRLEFQAGGLRPSSAVLERLSDIALLSDVIETMELTTTVSFDAPWDRFAIERARPQPRRIRLELLKANWGGLELWMAGDLRVAADGTPTGQITVKAKNWREMLALARTSGLLPEALAPTIERTLGFLAGLSGSPDTIDTPLTFKDGYVAFGPIPLGPAPRLHLR